MRYPLFLALILVEIIVLALFFVMSRVELHKRMDEIVELRKITRALYLTDLSVWTEARYTRNPSQADWFSPFQDYPSSIEHFPAGSIISPPPHYRSGR